MQDQGWCLSCRISTTRHVLCVFNSIWRRTVLSAEYKAQSDSSKKAVGAHQNCNADWRMPAVYILQRSTKLQMKQRQEARSQPQQKRAVRCTAAQCPCVWQGIFVQWCKGAGDLRSCAPWILQTHWQQEGTEYAEQVVCLCHQERLHTCSVAAEQGYALSTESLVLDFYLGTSRWCSAGKFCSDGFLDVQENCRASGRRAVLALDENSTDKESAVQQVVPSHADAPARVALMVQSARLW